MSVSHRERHFVRMSIRGGVPVMVKECHGCGINGVCSDGDASDFHAIRYNEGKAINWQPLCRACLGVSKAIERELRPEQHRNRDRRYRQETYADPERLEALRERRRHWQRERHAHNPEYVESRRQANRAWRERNGQEPGVKRARRSRFKQPPVVPGGPYKDWLTTLEPVLNDGGGWEVFAGVLGVDSRRLRDLRTGKSRLISVDAVDRSILAYPGFTVPGYGPVWSILDLYPEGVSFDRKVASWRPDLAA